MMPSVLIGYGCALMLLLCCHGAAYARSPALQSYTTCVRLIDAPVVVFSTADHAKLDRLVTLAPLDRIVNIQIWAPSADELATSTWSREEARAKAEVARNVIIAK